MLFRSVVLCQLMLRVTWILEHSGSSRGVSAFLAKRIFDVIMSDMELSVTGEEGDLSEETERDQTYEEEEEDQGRGETNPPFNGRQDDNQMEKRIISGRKEPEHRRMVDITRDKPVKVTVRVIVPVRDHPKFNFVGKLLGPKGNSLKRLQEDTMTKMAILGRGSMKDKHKEEELRLSGDPKFSHLHDDLHVEITAFAPPAEAHARMAYALADVRRFLVPDYNDDIRQEQMWEMQILKERPENSTLMEDNLGLHLLGTTIPIVPTAAETPSPTNSNRSQSPRTPPSNPLLDSVAAPVMLPSHHPALRGVAVHSSQPLVPPTVGTVNGRKRPLFSSSARHSFSPTKRTIMSILARARAAQEKQIPGYHLNGTEGNIVGMRQDGAVIGANLV